MPSTGPEPYWTLYCRPSFSYVLDLASSYRGCSQQVRKPQDLPGTQTFAEPVSKITLKSWPPTLI